MLRNFMHAKISHATITETELSYVGSITVDADILDKVGLEENEFVQIVNQNNGERLETYVIEGERGSKVFKLNGPAARKAHVGDKIFIIGYAQVDLAAEKKPVPKVYDCDLDQMIDTENRSLSLAG